MEEYTIVTQGSATYLERTLGADELLDEVDRGMLVSNQISGMLPLNIQWINADCRLLYNITGLTPLVQAARILEHEIRLSNFFMALCRAEKECDEYLLDPHKIDLTPEHIYSDGQAEEIKMDGDVVGRPEKVSDPEQTDFSDNLITLGNKTFLSFEIGHPSSEYQNILLGAVGEQVTQNYLIGFPEKVDESHIAAENLDERVVYREENGRFIEVERMPGEEYEEQFASREEYLNRMLSETQLKGLAADLGVPEALEVRYTQSERAYWEAGGCWEIYVEIDADKKVVAATSVDAETGELTRNILTYNGSGYWEAE